MTGSKAGGAGREGEEPAAPEGLAVLAAVETPEAPTGTEDSAAWLEAGRLLFAGPCTFLLGVAELSQLPAAGLGELAFVGRSNVGKSSLINALTGRRTLARTSNTPGRTQQLNFFDLGGRVWLVDLPGYGYAAESKAKVAAWTALVRAYLKGRVPLLRVCLLIDSRHGVMANDEEIMKLLDQAAVSYQLVLTKADKIKPAQAAARRGEAVAVAARHPAAHPEVLVTSAQAGTGIPELRATLAALV